jgi:ABC-type polysaccharide/polyol phosphate transport system ATPase subunit
MLPKGTIYARHVWKRFRADRRRMLLRDELEHLRNAVRGQSSSRWRWALRDIDLTVAPGESVGLIGINGSGKSTLLKVLARVTYPYAGSLEVAGRVGALIEVRAGIHPDLTGRENVYLYGSLLGLPRREVTRRFDAIVGFAELESAIDRQVKFYSSGMQMRLVTWRRGRPSREPYR